MSDNLVANDLVRFFAVLALVALVAWIASVDPFGIDEYVQRILGGLAGQGECPPNGWGHPSC